MSYDLNGRKTSRRSFAKLIGSTIGAVPFLVLVAGQGCQTKKKQEEIRQTSPITIGGGSSVSVHFDRCWYKDDNKDKLKQYWNSADEIEKLWIINENGASFPYPQATPGRTITVDCLRESDGNISKIVITCKPLGIEFEPADFPYDPVKDVHYSSDRKITRVWVSDVADPIFEAKDGRCLIRVDDPSR